MFHKARSGGKTNVMAALMRFFGADHTAEKHQPSGNRAAPLHIQQEIQVKAEAKRNRKLNRYASIDGTSGWYNG